MRVSTHLLPTLRTERVCSFCAMRAVSTDPRTHRLMMHAQLASDATVTQALFRKHQSLGFARLIGLPDTWSRGKVQLTHTAAKSLAPRPIFPAFDDLSHLVTLRACRKNASRRQRSVLLHCLPHTAGESQLFLKIYRPWLDSIQLRCFFGAAHLLQ